MKRKKPELLAPAGNMEKLKMALLYGADAGRNPGVCMETAPVISLSALQGSTPEDGKDGLFRIHAGGLVLTPFYRLGEDGAFYRSWLRIAP